MEALLHQLNEHAGVQDTPAKVEDLEILIEGDEVRTSFKLVPIGNMDAKKWYVLNENLEGRIKAFVATNLKS